MTYAQKLRDPRWQKKRLQILERDNWTCCICKSTTKNLQVHHLYYSKLNPWEYDDKCYQTLCEDCHEVRQELVDKMVAAIRMALRDVATHNLNTAANWLMEQAMESMSDDSFTVHMKSTLNEAARISKAGNGLLVDGLFTDSVMGLCSVQMFGAESTPRALMSCKKAVEVMEAAVKGNGE